MKITVYTDGSSRGNPGPGGWGAIVVFKNTITELGGREDMTTNNKMELMACIASLDFLNDKNTEDQIILYSDSQYVIKGMTEWIHGWQRNNWKNSQKKDVLNRELWEKLLDLSLGKNIQWNYIKGHADNPGNNRCDEIATSFADDKKIKLYIGSVDSYSLRIV